MKTWDDWSDFEINCSVAIALGCDVVIEFTPSSSSVYCGYEGLKSTQDERDYCNNPAYMWPIILENNIVATPCMGASIGDATGYSEHQNPVISEFNDNSKALRAAAIVFLMMNGVNPE